MKDSKEYLTKEKFTELETELANLKNVRRKEVAESLEYAKSLGDLSENAEYQEAREMQANIEDRIAKLESILSSAEIMSNRHADTIDIGSSVVVKKGVEKETRLWHIVGSEESNMSEGKLSHRSPLGEALIGKRKGESFTFKTPGGAVEYTVISVE